MRRGYWGANLGQPHSIPVKESGKCGSVTVRVSNAHDWGHRHSDGVLPRGQANPPCQLVVLLLTLASKLIPAPRGTSLVASPAVKRLLQLAGIEDAYTSSAGSTKTLENTLKATFAAISNTYGFLTPNLWKETKLIRSPLEEFADTLRSDKRY